MRSVFRLAAALLVCGSALHALPLRALPPRALPTTRELVVPNDNRLPAGRLADGVLVLHLEARRGTWYPEGPGGRGLDVAAWAEVGRPLQNPGPLVRVPAGTRVRATLHNALDRPLTVYGFGARRGPADSVVIAAGATTPVEFVAGTPGTFYYAAKLVPGPLGARLTEDTQLNGALVVDAPRGGDGVEPRNDRVFVLSWWFTLDTTSRTGLGTGTMAINGLSWPHTERVDLVQGDSVRWRLVNLTSADHPMHLHGFYFRVDAKGDGRADTVYAAAARRAAVTEVLAPAQTMTLAWSPQRPGNWIFHCHYASHVSALASLDYERGAMRADADHAMASHMAGAPHQMFGLVLGIRVAPRPAALAVARAGRAERALRIIVRQRDGVYGDSPGYAFVLGGSADERSGALPVPARPLVLERNEPVAITIVNEAREPATIHWHGIELESYPDGVPGWSGDGQHLLPHVAPGDSMTVHWTPPRAGTFMYHSHFDEMQQINAGLYGAIVVLEPGQRFDPETDRVFFVGQRGPTTNVIRGPFAPLTLNGDTLPAPIALRAGVAYRFRFLNLSDDLPSIVTLADGPRPATWRAVAKDGADLPAAQATARPAVLVFDPGEVYDFAFTPERPGDLTLSFGHLNIPGLPHVAPVPVAVRVR